MKTQRKKVVVVFDERKIAAECTMDDPNNTPKERIRRTKTMLTKMARFMDADKIEYQDFGKSERYIITRGKKKLTLHAKGLGCEGGFLIAT